MKSKGLLAHAILAVGGLVTAYLVWTDDSPDVDESEVTIFECSPETLTRAVLVEGEQTVTLDVTQGDDEPSVAFTVARRPAEGEATSTRFVGAAEAVAYLSKIAPLRARRSLGRVTEAQLAEIDLDEPGGTLTLSCGARSQSFQLGGRAFGEGDRYLRAEGGPEVHLVESARIAPLAAAQAQLMQRNLHVFDWTEVDALTVRAYGTDKRLHQRSRRSAERAEWVDAAAPDRRNELYGNWLSAYPRVRVQAYLEEGALPGADLGESASPPEEVMLLEMFDEDGERVGRAEMQRVTAPERAYYMRTETTHGWVRVPTSVAQAFAENLRPVLGLEPLEEEPEPPQAAPDAGVPADGAAAPTEAAPTEAAPTGAAPTGAAPTGAAPTGAAPTGAAPTGAAPTEAAPTEAAPTEAAPTAPAPRRRPRARPPAGGAAQEAAPPPASEG